VSSLSSTAQTGVTPGLSVDILLVLYPASDVVATNREFGRVAHTPMYGGTLTE
jgi:hypothetical protein